MKSNKLPELLALVGVAFGVFMEKWILSAPDAFVWPFSFFTDSLVPFIRVNGFVMILVFQVTAIVAIFHNIRRSNEIN